MVHTFCEKKAVVGLIPHGIHFYQMLSFFMPFVLILRILALLIIIADSFFIGRLFTISLRLLSTSLSYVIGQCNRTARRYEIQVKVNYIMKVKQCRYRLVGF